MRAIAAMLLAALLLASCSRKVYVPVESVKHVTDTVRLVNLRTDSVWQHDSVAVYVSGDTVRITQWRDRYRYRMATDTVYKARHDTIREPYPVEVEKRVEVERKLSLWQRAVQCVGYATLCLLALLGVGWGLKKWAQSKVPRI